MSLPRSSCKHRRRVLLQNRSSLYLLTCTVFDWRSHTMVPRIRDFLICCERAQEAWTQPGQSAVHRVQTESRVLPEPHTSCAVPDHRTCDYFAGEDLNAVLHIISKHRLFHTGQSDCLSGPILAPLHRKRQLLCTITSKGREGSPQADHMIGLVVQNAAQRQANGQQLRAQKLATHDADF